MDTTRIKLGYRRDEPTPSNLFSDHDWFRTHEAELLAHYGECLVLVYQEQVIGRGDTYEAVIADAEKNLSPDITIATPILEFLRQRHPFLRVCPSSSPVSQ